MRILTLVPFLHARGSVEVEQAAELLGVSREQVLSDLRVLFMCGLPGGYPDDLIDVDIDTLEGEGVIRVTNADYLARPLRLTPTEASAMIVAVRALRGSAGADTRPIVDRVLGKLEGAAASAAAPVHVEPDEGQDAAEALLARRLAEAARAGRQVRLTYWTPARDEVSERVVDPHAVVGREGHSYLDAFCHSAEAPRLFRLDRVGAAEVLDSAVATPAPAPRDLAPGLLAASTGATRVTLRLAPPAAWVADYYPVEEARDDPDGPDGTLLVAVPVADPRWLTRLLLRVAPHAQVVAPQAYGEAARAEAARALGLYGEVDPRA